MFDESKNLHESGMVEGMKDEHTNEPLEGSVASHHEEAADVNRYVLEFNTELDSADLSNPEVFSEWMNKAEYIKSNNEAEGEKWIGILKDRVNSLSETK